MITGLNLVACDGVVQESELYPSLTYPLAESDNMELCDSGDRDALVIPD